MGQLKKPLNFASCGRPNFIIPKTTISIHIHVFSHGFPTILKWTRVNDPPSAGVNWAMGPVTPCR